MNIDTGTFAAITAEAEMLREHARRAAPGRHRRPPQPRGWRKPRPVDNFWRGGYVTAMREMLELAISEAARTDSTGEVLHSVLEAALAAEEVHQADHIPPAWLEGGQP